MKTKILTWTENKIDKLLKNKNFRNNQNYIFSQKEKNKIWDLFLYNNWDSDIWLLLALLIISLILWPILSFLFNLWLLFLPITLSVFYFNYFRNIKTQSLIIIKRDLSDYMFFYSIRAVSKFMKDKLNEKYYFFIK
jgi:hypothetical protein